MRRILLLSIFFAVAVQAAQPTHVVIADAAPDAVATSLMPVPIFNFAVHSLAFSPEGGMLATGDGAGTVRLWDVATGERKASILAHTNWAFSVDWSPHGQVLATGGGDNVVRLFDIARPAQPFRTFRGHSNDVHAVKFTPDGQHLVSAGDDRDIIIWNATTSTLVQRWRAHNKAIPAMDISPDGMSLASGSRDNSIRIWEPKTGELKRELTGHSGDVLSVQFSPDRRSLASASYDRTVRVWDVTTGEAAYILKGHTNRVFSVAFSPNGSLLASAGDSTLRIWNTTDGQQVSVTVLNGAIDDGGQLVAENLSAVAFSPNGILIAVSSTTGATALVEAATGKVLRRLVPKDGGAVKLRP